MNKKASFKDWFVLALIGAGFLICVLIYQFIKSWLEKKGLLKYL